MTTENNNTILLVEDDVILAMTEKNSLEDYGYKIIIANSGEEAIDIVKKAPGINLILMDIDLGKGIDGIKAAALILKDHDIPVVFLSSHTEPEIVEKTEEITSYGYVVKSSSNTVLDASIKMAYKLFNSNIKLTNELAMRKQMEDDLFKSEKKYRGIIDSSPMGIHQYELKNDGRLIFTGANPAADKILGVDNSVFIGKTIEEAFPPLADTEVPVRYKEVAKTGIQWHTEQIDYADDKIRGAFYVIAFRTAENTMAANFLDITEQKKAEETIQTAEALYQNLVETSQDLIWQCDSEGRYTYLNPAWEQIFGYKIEEMLGKKFSDFQIPEMAERDMREHTRLLQGNMVKGFETIHIGKTGKEIHLVFNAKYLSDKHGNITGTCGTAYDITERKLSEQRLLLEEEKFKNVFESANVGKSITHPSGEIHVNKAFCEMLGYNPDELQKKKWQEITPEDEIESIQNELEPLLKGTKKSARFNKRYLHKNGSFIWADVSVVLQLDADLKPLYFITTVIDITKRKLAEEMSQMSEANFRNLTENMKDGIVIATVKGNHVYANWHAAKLCGYSRDEMLKTNMKDLADPASYPILQQRLQDRIAGLPLPDTYETIIRRKDGTSFYADVSGTKTIWQGEECDLVLFRDITERKNSEQKLLDDEEKFRLMIKNSNDTFVLINEKGEQFYISDAAVRHTGFEIDELKGPIQDVIYPDDLEIVLKAWNDILSKKEEIVRVQYRHKHKYKDYIWYEAVAQNFLDNPVINAVIVNVRDITENKEAEDKIKMQLSEKVTLLKEVHHRIKNNIASIEGILSLQAESTGNTEVKAALQDSITRVQSMRVIYEKLLAGDDYHEVSIKAYIESLVDSIASLYPESVKVTIEKQISDFNINTKKLIPIGIIINELITNIFKYAFKGRDNGRVEIILDRNESQINLTIQDNGNGIDEKAEMNKSPGFGLTLVNMLIEQLEGSCSFENQNGTRIAMKLDI